MTSRRSLMMPAAAGSVLLTMMALGQVFQRQAWFLPSLVAVALAFGTGWLARRLDVPGMLAPALSLLAMLALLGIVFAPETTAAGFPTASTMQAIGDSLGSAFVDIRELAPPAEPTPALTLLATGGVFLVAMLVDIFVFWLRRPVAAGMPLLALFLIPTAMAPKGNVFAFVLAATGYLGILVAEGRDRARAWGRRLSGLDIPDEVADVSHVARVGRRIGSAAVGIALCVPIALPSVGPGMFTGSGNGIFGRGGSGTTAYVLNPIVEIKARLIRSERQELVYVRTPRPQYLRLASLDVFDGEQWTIKRRPAGSDNRVGTGNDERIPLPDELRDRPTETVAYDVTVGPDLQNKWVPLAYAPTYVSLDDGDWRYESWGRSVFSTDETAANLTYRAEAQVWEPSPDLLREGGEIPKAIRDEYLQLPPGEAPLSAREVLARHTAGLENPYDRARALNAYFFSSGEFTYDDTVASGNGTNALDDFLQRRTGYCEQFAATMAYLARLTGIPARVIVGFTPGTQRADGTWVITNKDAHAWPELYFPSAGWVRFEPTPRNGTAPPGYALPEEAPGPGGADVEPSADPASPQPSASAGDGGRGAQEARRPGDDPSTPQDESLVPEEGGVPVVPLTGLALAGLVATPSFVGWATRRRRRIHAGDGVARIHAAWDSLADAAEDAGHPLRAADSPRGAARRLVASAALTGAVADEVQRLASAEERARYARTVPPVDGLDAGARAIRRTMLGALPRAARVRAMVFPRSSMRRNAEAVRAAAGAVERARDTARERALRLLPRRRTRAA